MLTKFMKTYGLYFSIEESGLSNSVIEPLLTIVLLVHLEFIIDAENILINTRYLFHCP